MNTMLHVAVMTALLCCCQSSEQAAEEPDRAALEPYVSFLQNQTRSPVEYVLDLFETYDIIILCERVHIENTQYDLIYNLVTDPRFTKQVGHVFTEVGSSHLQPLVEDFLQTGSLTEDEAEERLQNIYKNFDYFPMWNKTNFYLFLSRIHEFNNTLPPDSKIHIHPSDVSFSWEEMTAEKYRAFEQTLGNRDEIMARQIIDIFDDLQQSSERKKALVIMNFRHAFPHIEYGVQGRLRQVENVGGFLMAMYPGRVANVMINSIRLLPESSDNKAVFVPLQEGKWDAVFEVLGNTERGFNFADTPFGNDIFDYFPYAEQYRYRDIFTGYVFFKPLNEHEMSTGTPGLIDDNFQEELMKRYRITGDRRSDKEITKEIENNKTVLTFGYENEQYFSGADYEEKIHAWLR